LKKKGILYLIAGVLALQFGGLIALEWYLSPTDAFSVVTTAQAQGTIKTEEREIEPPLDSVIYDIDARGRTIGYLDHHDQLVVKNKKNQTLAVVKMTGDVHYLTWMDHGKTLFYARAIYGKNEFGVVKVTENKLLPLFDLHVKNIEIEKSFKSTYTQSIHLIYKQNGQRYLGYYEAIFGFRSSPLPGQEPKEYRFDEKKDVLTLVYEGGKEILYSHGKPDGSRQQQANGNQAGANAGKNSGTHVAPLSNLK
jgi:hypothetical protein